MRIIASTLIMLTVFCLCTRANAQLAAGQSLGLDFGNQQDVGGVSPPANWNFIDNANTRTTLTEETTGTSVNVGLTLESGDGTPVNFFNDDSHELGSPDGLTGAGPVPAPFNTAVAEDWSGVVNADSYDITITGLDDSLTYEFDFLIGAFTNNTVTNGLTLTADGQSAAIADIGLTPRFNSLTGLSTDGMGNLLIQILEANVDGTSVPVISGLYLTAMGGGGGGLACDFDADGDCDHADIDALYGLASPDIAQWLSQAEDTNNLWKTDAVNNPNGASTDAYAIGDVNLDGDVNSTDLGLLLNNFNNTNGLPPAGVGWGGGDLNADGNVNSIDLGQLLNNFNFTSAAAVSAVPEPGAFALVGIGMLGLLTRRRRISHRPAFERNAG